MGTAATLAVAAGLGLTATAAIATGADALRVAVLLAIAPLLEEVLFRAGLHESLLARPVTARVASVATAIAFGVSHAAVHGDLAALVFALPALAIGAVYERTRRLRDCVLVHAAMNAVWLTWGIVQP